MLNNPIVAGAAASAGVNTSGLEGLIGAGAGAALVAWSARRGKQREDAAYDEAAAREKARASEEKAARDRARLEAQVQVLTMLADPRQLSAALQAQAAAVPTPAPTPAPARSGESGGA